MTNRWSGNLRMNTISQSEKRTNSCNQVCGVCCLQIPPLNAPHYSDAGSDNTDGHRSYHMMGHYLRANVFSGPSVVWSSLVKDSYTCHHLPAIIQDAEHWHGHKTDHLVKWTEQNFLNKQLHKLLKEMEVKGVAKRA